VRVKQHGRRAVKASAANKGSVKELTDVANDREEIARELQVLEAELKRLEAEYNMFVGARPS
jgi:hypothetical protein